MQSISQTYFPTSQIGLRDFSEHVIALISDFDLHAMFNSDDLSNDWKEEFDFRKTYYSNSSNFEIRVNLTTDDYFKYRLLYNSADFSINLSYETFSDMTNGILQIDLNGLIETHHLVIKLDGFLKGLELKPQQQAKSNEDPNDNMPKDAGGYSEYVVPIKSKLDIFIETQRVDILEGGIVKSLCITEDSVIIGEMVPNDIHSFQSVELKFQDFLEKSDLNRLGIEIFGKEILDETVRIVKSKYIPPKIKSLKREEKKSFIKNGEGSISYVVRINDTDISIGEFDHNIKDSGGTIEISFKDFIEKKEGQDMVKEYLGNDILNEVIEGVRLKYVPEIKYDRHYHIDGEGTRVYTVSIDEKTITFGEYDKMHSQGGGARSYSFKDFIENKSGQDFVISCFGADTLKKIIITVEGLL